MPEQPPAPATPTTPESSAKLPPRWFIRSVWRLHRALYRTSGGRLGLAEPRAGKKMGMMRLRAIGRRSGEERAVILGYWQRGDDLVTLAMNGWGAAEPAWWLNVQADPDVHVDLVGGSRAVRARAATGDERAELWAGFDDYVGWGDLEQFAKLRPSETAVVVFEPRA